MMNLFKKSFKIKVDTSHTPHLTGYNSKINDTWFYSDQIFESGKIYGLISEYRQGGTYLSYLLGGQIGFDKIKIYCNDCELHQNILRQVSINLEPCENSSGNLIVKKAIEKAIVNNSGRESFQDIAERFLLTPERTGRKLRCLSGERWRAAAALGYAQNKKIYYAPYQSSMFYYQMCQSSLLKALRELTGSGAVVLLPTGSDTLMKHIADELVYISPPFDIKGLKQSYIERYGKDWIH